MADPLEEEDITDMHMLVIEEHENGVEVDDPSGKLTPDERLMMILRALVLELAEEIAIAIESTKEDAEDDD